MDGPRPSEQEARLARKTHSPSWRRRVATAALAAGCLVAVPPAAAPASTSTLSFKPEADTWVSASSPTSSFGGASTLTVDASPQKQAYLRFDVEGLAGRTVVGARLRMFQTAGSDHGGRVFSISATNWPESITWDTKPAIDGPQLGTFGPVVASTYYEADLGAPAVADGPIAVAVTSPSSDDARWSTREKVSSSAGQVKVPRLILEVESGDSVTDGLSEVAGPLVGSSSPTSYGNQHRLAITEAGRLLTVHGLHGAGVQFAWRDAAGNWQNQTTGATPDGILLSNTGTGDWPASIAVARDSGGVEHAWVVAARPSTTKVGPVYIRRLSDLDSPAGPTVGPRVELDSPALGAFKPDIAFESAPGGETRGAVLWQRRSADTEYQTVTGWLTDLDDDVPVVHDRTVINSSTGAQRSGTLVPSGAGMQALIRPGTSPLALFTHAPAAPLAEWTRSANGMSVSSSASPTAAALDSGELLSVVETDVANHVVKVQRYSGGGVPLTTELTLTGYSTPSIASDGVNAWIVMVRVSDGAVVSRQFSPGSGWASADQVEIAPGPGLSPYAYPNAIRETDGRLRFVVEGFGAKSVTSSVLGFQRGL